MAVKTITIDLEAYEALARHKRPGQSFSQVIKERVGTRKTGRELWQVLADIALSEEALDLVQEQVRARRRDRAKAAKL